MKCMEKAYAKVNLTLQVGSRRPDGYHAVMSVIQRISLWDTVTVERGTGRDTLLCSVPVTENVDDNLCMKAARAFFAETGTKSDGVTITLEKHIPVQAGLGGGSSDAAAVLLAVFVHPATYWQLIPPGLLFVAVYAASMWLFGMNRYERGLVTGPLRRILHRQ